MGKFVNINGPIVADTVYSDNVLVARDTGFTLPAVTPVTADLQAMGTMSMPIWSLIEDMEATITKIGHDMGLKNLVTPAMKPLEIRWVQTVTDANGNTKNVGCKAFLKGIPKGLPEVGGEVGSTVENSVALSISRYQLFVDGQEMWLVDRLAGILRINGKNYADLDSML